MPPVAEKQCHKLKDKTSYKFLWSLFVDDNEGLSSIKSSRYIPRETSKSSFILIRMHLHMYLIYPCYREKQLQQVLALSLVV